MPGIVRGQDISDFDTIAALPLDGMEPAARPTIPGPATRPAIEQPVNAPPPLAPKYLTGNWWGARTTLENHGISIEGRFTADYGKNLTGGRDTTGDAFDEVFALNLTFDMEKLAKLRGGYAYLSLQQEAGTSASDYAGNAQDVSNLIADGRRQISEAWYLQGLAGGAVLLKAGKIDVLEDFAFPDFAADFSNSGMGVPISNSVLPTYPNQALGADAFVYPSQHFYFGVGCWDGALAEGKKVGENGPRTLFGSPSDLLLIAETGAKWTLSHDTLSGRLRGGCWDQTQTPADRRVLGGYVALDQKLWRENPSRKDDDQGIGMFLQYDAADNDVMPIRYHASGGVVWKGAIPQGDNDVIGLGSTFAKFTDADHLPKDYEWVVEGFYKIQVTGFMSLKPGLQYIANPTGGLSRDALVACVRFQLEI